MQETYEVESHAASIILVHNLPSGDPTLSQDNVKLTQRVLEMSKMIEIKLFDTLSSITRNTIVYVRIPIYGRTVDAIYL
ncbi:hypothetical protein CGW93_04615 [candidate division bacterium WOR-3 4484_18]|uniref:MPN domain-containing protein n=1 Tax=candidate division WOR-3 bacterium 4484_18 TaxID=2020626 RepID=A0A257LSG4_UNCW3|nr:MAG: hypothetical protein CGW93_04615 [candidate division bacterium WOR-3 4484_18]